MARRPQPCEMPTWAHIQTLLPKVRSSLGACVPCGRWVMPPPCTVWGVLEISDTKNPGVWWVQESVPYYG